MRLYRLNKYLDKLSTVIGQQIGTCSPGGGGGGGGALLFHGGGGQ